MLLVEWSASGIRVFDAVKRTWTEGSSLRQCLGGTSTKDAVVAISSRSAFIRIVNVPSVSREEMQRTIALKLVPLLPFQPGEYVFGFKIGAAPTGGGKQAIVGAVKTELLRDILGQAKECGLRIHSIVPLAFGSWLAAKAHGIRDGAVVEVASEFLAIDIMIHGELGYSRTLPVPASADGVAAEIQRTFGMAEVASGPILSTGSSVSGVSQQETRHAIEFLADHSLGHRQLFSLELPEAAASRRSRASNAAMQRAILAVLAAVALGSYEYTSRTVAQKVSNRQSTDNSRRVTAARHEQQASLTSQAEELSRNSLVHTAFHPPQSFSDILTVLGAPEGHKLWLNGLTLEKGRPIVLRGVAATGKDLSDYIDEISVGDRFRGLKVLSATNGAIGKKSVVQFSITGWIVGNLPLDAPPKEVTR